MPDAPVELRLNIPESAPKLALHLHAEISTGVAGHDLEKLLDKPSPVPGKRMTARQIRDSLAHLGLVYLQSVVEAREQYAFDQKRQGDESET